MGGGGAASEADGRVAAEGTAAELLGRAEPALKG